MSALMRKLDARNYYTATRKYDLSFPRLIEDIDCDIVIIGGGFSGINTALELAEKGLTNIVILEGRYLGYGGTGRNGGQVMAGIGHDIEAVRKHVGPEGLDVLFKIANLGAGIIKERIKKYNIDADFCPGYGYLAFNKRQQKTLEQWLKDFKSVTPDEEIDLVTGKDVQSVVGSTAYCAALKHMGGGHVNSLNLLLGEAKAATSHGVRIFENSPAVKVTYGDRITVRTAAGTVKAQKLLWACNGFLDGMEPYIWKKTLNTYAFQIATEPLSDELINKISPIRGAYSDIRPVIDYYRVTKENRLLFGLATRYIDYIPENLAEWNRKFMLDIFPYLDKVKIDMAWGGPLCCSVNLFPQIGSLPEHPNVFFVQGYSGFGVTPSHIVCKVLAEGMSEGSKRYELMSSIPHRNVVAKTIARPLLATAGKLWHQLSGQLSGR